MSKRRTPVRLRGGPFAGHTIPLHRDGTTLAFKIGNYIGRYVAARWQDASVPG